jgi:hypothetical protein
LREAVRKRLIFLGCLKTGSVSLSSNLCASEPPVFNREKFNESSAQGTEHYRYKQNAQKKHLDLSGMNQVDSLILHNE